MKKLITLCALTALLISSCDSPLRDLSETENISQINQAETGIPPSATRAEADSMRKAAWQKFQAINGNNWQIRRSQKTGLPVSVFLGLTKKTYRESPREAARAFLADHPALFGFAEHLKYVKTQTYRGISHVTFNQVVNGVPVYEAQFQVHLRRNGRVDMANGTYYPKINVSTVPSLSASAAIQAARSKLKTSGNIDFQTTSKLVIYKDKKKFHLAWKLILFSKEPLIDRFYMIDAHTGTILAQSSRLTDAIGDGDVYLTHPDPINPGSTPVINKTLYRLTGNDRLQGAYVNVVNDEGPRAYSAITSFTYSPGNPHFDEVNLYYHVDRFRYEFVNVFDDGSIVFEQIRAHAHAYSPQYQDLNAWFSPSTQDLYFGDASSSPSLRDFAKSNQVIYHEYGHAVIYDLENGITSHNNPNEEGAISEGLPDYWAGAFTDNPISGAYIIGDPSGVRDIQNPEISSYQEYQSKAPVDPHKGGEFFSAILWDLRAEIGESTFNALTFSALYRLDGSPTFLEFRDALMEADDAWNGGVNNHTIRNTFANAGIGSPYVPPVQVTITGPHQVQPNTYPSWTANPSGGTPPYQYHWQIRVQRRPLTKPTTPWYNFGNQKTVGRTYSPLIAWVELKVTVTGSNNKTGTSPVFHSEFMQPLNTLAIDTLTDAEVMKKIREWIRQPVSTGQQK